MGFNVFETNREVLHFQRTRETILKFLSQQAGILARLDQKNMIITIQDEKR